MYHRSTAVLPQSVLRAAVVLLVLLGPNVGFCWFLRVLGGLREPMETRDCWWVQTCKTSGWWMLDLAECVHEWWLDVDSALNKHCSTSEEHRGRLISCWLLGLSDMLRMCVCVCFRVWMLSQESRERKGFWEYLDPGWAVIFTSLTRSDRSLSNTGFSRVLGNCFCSPKRASKTCWRTLCWSVTVFSFYWEWTVTTLQQL